MATVFLNYLFNGFSIKPNHKAHKTPNYKVYTFARQVYNTFLKLGNFECIKGKWNNNKELPTVNKLRLELKEDINFQGNNTTLRRILKKLGFRFKRCQSKRKVLMERYDITV